MEAAEVVEAAVVEAVDAEQAFARLGAPVRPAAGDGREARSRAPAPLPRWDGPAKAAAYRAAELVRAETLVAEAEACVCEAEAALARSGGRRGRCREGGALGRSASH